jgi:hypothetical protein
MTSVKVFILTGRLKWYYLVTVNSILLKKGRVTARLLCCDFDQQQAAFYWGMVGPPGQVEALVSNHWTMTIKEPVSFVSNAAWPVELTAGRYALASLTVSGFMSFAVLLIFKSHSSTWS